MEPRVPILMYHKVAPLERGTNLPGHYVGPRQFDLHLRALQALKYCTVSLDLLYESPLSPRPIAITFDDGYHNFIEHALPCLERHGFTSTVFLVANQIGGTNAWDPDDRQVPLMTAAEIQDAGRRGTEFGSHTLDHANLAEVSEDEAWRQISGSREALEPIIGRPIKTFCYPYGAKTAEVEAMVERAGYRLACSTEKGINDSTTPRYRLKRINVRRDTSLPVFVAKLWRAHRDGRR